MNTINWSTYKFHPSSVKNLMIEPRLKSETISETTKAYLLEVYIEEVYGRRKIESVANKFMRKGTMCETDSIELLERVKGETFFKNNNQLTNAWFVGTPDVIAIDKVIDIKTSWDLWTFAGVDEDQAKKDYYYQVLAYMDLTKTQKAELVYCLVSTPPEMINDEMYRPSFYMDEVESEKYRNNYKFDDIDEKSRVKIYTFDYSEEDIERVESKIVLAREYLASIKI